MQAWGNFSQPESIEKKGRDGIMAGYLFVVSGDPATARNTVYAILADQGFKLEQTGEWTAKAERGSGAASILLGAAAGKKGRHVKLDIVCTTDAQGLLNVTFRQGTSGASGGIIGAMQANKIYQEVYDTVGASLQQAGVLVSGAPLK
jgi:hypothetical protein